MIWSYIFLCFNNWIVELGVVELHLIIVQVFFMQFQQLLVDWIFWWFYLEHFLLVDVRTPRFLKRLQIEPHLQYRFCSLCKIAAGDLFCRNFACFDYFCQRCWQKIHVGNMSSHKAVTRHSKSSQPVFHPHIQAQTVSTVIGANGF